jgi:hypothetical protein
VGPFGAHGWLVAEAEVDPAGRRLVTLSWGDRMIVWDVADPAPPPRPESSPAALLRAACAVAYRDLSRAEWRQYLPDRPWQATCTDLL